MRKILGFGVVLSVVSLSAAVGTAYGQTGGGGRGAGAGGRTASTVVNDVQQVTNGGAATTTDGTTPGLPGQAVTTPPQPGGIGTTPGNVPQVPGTAGTVLNQAGVTPTQPGGIGTTPGNTPQVPGTAGAVLNQSGVMPTQPGGIGTTPGNVPQVPGTTGTVLNQSGVMPTNPASTAAGTMNPAAGVQQGAYPGAGTAVTPGYTNQVMPGIAGYNSVNPMGTTMTPGSNYAGTAGVPYTTGATTGYSSMYVTPGYYTTQPQTYQVQQRRGLFGGLFRRRNRVVYSTSPYGYNATGYTTVPTTGTYTYSTSPY